MLLLQKMLTFKVENCCLPSAHLVLCSKLFVSFAGINSRFNCEHS